MSPRSRQLLFIAAWVWLFLGIAVAFLLRKQAARAVWTHPEDEGWRELSDEELGA